MMMMTRVYFTKKLPDECMRPSSKDGVLRVEVHIKETFNNPIEFMIPGGPMTEYEAVLLPCLTLQSFRSPRVCEKKFS